MTGQQCGAEQEAFGQVLVCDQLAGHRGPHGGSCEKPFLAGAWCDLPCRGRLCRGPCTEAESRAPSRG